MDFEYGVRHDPGHVLRSSETMYEGRIVRVLRQSFRAPNGAELVQDVISLPAAVAVVPLVAAASGELCVVLVEQFRNAAGGFIHEIPAGLVDAGEEPEAAARRELEEETGYRAGRMQRLASLLMLPGTSRHRLHFFLAEDLSAGSQRLEESECLSVRLLPFAPLVRSLTAEPPGSSVVVDSKTHLGLLHSAALLNLRRERGAGCPGAPR